MSEEKLKSFYELCQTYRTASIQKPDEVVFAYQALVSWVEKEQEEVVANWKHVAAEWKAISDRERQTIDTYKTHIANLEKKLAHLESDSGAALIQAALHYLDLNNESMDLDTYCLARFQAHEKMEAAARAWREDHPT